MKKNKLKEDVSVEEVDIVIEKIIPLFQSALERCGTKLTIQETKNLVEKMGIRIAIVNNTKSIDPSTQHNSVY